MSRLRRQRGFTLIETLMTLSLLSVVIGAVVSAFVAFLDNQRTSDQQTEAQERARLATGALAAQLRNLAGPVDFSPDAVEVAQPFDLIFKTVDQQAKPAGSANARNIMRARYCLAAPSGGSSTLIRQEQRWTTAAEPARPTTGCGGSGWSTTSTAADGVVNIPEGNTSVFSYGPAGASPTDIKSIRFDLLVDSDTRDDRRQARISSAVFLRNQNRRPVADFTATYTGNGRVVVLNGSGSEDPDGHALDSDGFTWTVNGSPLTAANQQGMVAYWTAPAGGTYNVTLQVRDQSGLSSLAVPTKAVVVP